MYKTCRTCFPGRPCRWRRSSSSPCNGARPCSPRYWLRSVLRSSAGKRAGVAAARFVGGAAKGGAGEMQRLAHFNLKHHMPGQRTRHHIYRGDDLLPLTLQPQHTPFTC